MVATSLCPRGAFQLLEWSEKAHRKRASKQKADVILRPTLYCQEATLLACPLFVLCKACQTEQSSLTLKLHAAVHNRTCKDTGLPPPVLSCSSKQLQVCQG